MRSKKDFESLREQARLMFMSGTPQNVIAERLEVSKVTVNKWVDDGGWKEARAAKNITRPELVNKLLVTIDKLLEEVNKSEDATMIANVGDKLSKLAAVIEKLDKKASVVDSVEVFMSFGNWLQSRSAFDKELTPDTLIKVNKYQDIYVTEQINNKAG